MSGRRGYLRKWTVVLVGACAVDTILTVPQFPGEDSKLRATSLVKRRGGNCPNTLEVLHQLVQLDHTKRKSKEDVETLSTQQRAVIQNLKLISVLPSKKSLAMPFIYDSFELGTGEKLIDFSYCLHREDHVEPISSYIISSQATGSRTIVNHNDLPEMTLKEFERMTDKRHLITKSDPEDEPMWFHFEGRNCETTWQCMEHLQSIADVSKRYETDNVVISVELEKPGREGLQELVEKAAVVFYSRSWAEGQGYKSAEECLMHQAQTMSHNRGWAGARGKLLICTWDKLGASALHMLYEKGMILTIDPPGVIHSPAFAVSDADIIDTVGAGDTFIAGMIYRFVHEGHWHKFKDNMDFANTLAGWKIMQQGFSGLADKMIDRL